MRPLISITVPHFRGPDARSWIGIGIYVLTVVALVLYVVVPDIRGDEFFRTITTLIVGAFIKDVVGWAYSATKSGGELAASQSRVIESQMGTGQPPPKDAVEGAHQTADAATKRADEISADNQLGESR